MRSAVLAVFAIFFSTSATAEQAWKPIGPPLVAALDVNAQGQVTHAQLVGNNILPALQALVTQTTRNWRFVPASVDGKTAPSRTYASLAAEARKVDGGEQLRLRYMSHGPGRSFIQIPAYPPQMARQLIEAKVTIEAAVQADGTLSDVHVVDARTTHSVKGEPFYRTTVDAFKKARFLPEMVDDRPVITHIRLFVPFCLVEAGRESKGPTPCTIGHLDHAMDTPHSAIDDSRYTTGRFADIPIALDSPLKLAAAQP